MSDTPTEPPSGSPVVHPPSRSKLGRVLPIAALSLVLTIPCCPFIVIPLDVYNSHRERQRLLHETDHHALLAASRELMRRHAGEQIDQPDTDPRVPAIIRELGPSYMTVSEKQLRVELHGGFDHYGFVAHAEDVDDDDHWGKLIDGLYYYTE